MKTIQNRIRLFRFAALWRFRAIRYENGPILHREVAKIGMKEIAELRRLSRQTDCKLNALIASQDRTDATLRAFMESLRKSGNGNGGRAR